MKCHNAALCIVLAGFLITPAWADDQSGSRVRKETAAKIGELLGVQEFIQGSVTQFDEESMGGSLGGAITSMFSSASVTTATVGMDIRIYDASTGVILQAHQVEKKARKVGVSASNWKSGLSGDWQSKTGLGEASRDALKEAVGIIVKKLDAIPWEGRLVDVKGDKIYLNSGGETGMEKDTVLEVFHKGEDLVDPATGLSLGSTEEKIGEINIGEVSKKFSICKTVSGKGFARGDIVRFPSVSTKTYQPKKRIAVAAFNVKMPGVGWDLGGGLSDMLITELVGTEKFIVLERQALDKILAEQNLGAAPAPSPATAPAVPVASAPARHSAPAISPEIYSRFAVMAFGMAFSAGGYWLGSKDFAPGEWTQWSSNSRSYVSEKAYLKKEKNGNEWWRVTIKTDNNNRDDVLIFEGMFTPERSRLLRLRAKFPNQEAGEIPVTEGQFYNAPSKLTKESRDGAIVGKESIEVKAGKFKTDKALYSVMGAGVSEWWLADSVPGGVVKYLFKEKKSGDAVYAMELSSHGSDATTVLNSY